MENYWVIVIRHFSTINKGRNYAQSFVEQCLNGSKLVTERFLTWLMYYLTAFNTIVTVIFWPMGIDRLVASALSKSHHQVQHCAKLSVTKPIKM
ncbi:hypothetical protein ACFP1L_00270 [Lactiplantibacillus nangangensis]|uniref:Uncharacterized protein n=1 Tax=Lactiplantibacillus nangangensis TaxID=2559917 RepID=A0ABW1SFK6_9LACO|nr:hypothetical protein [Lactiplantibacillus nangangensis]